MKNLQKGFVIPLLLAIIAVLVVGGGVYVYKNKKVETPEVNLPNVENANPTPITSDRSNTTENTNSASSIIKPEAVAIKKDKTSTIAYDDLNFSFSYPNDWYVYKDEGKDKSRVYLVKDSSDLEGSFFQEIQSTGKTHIEMGLYTDRYTAEIIKSMYNPIKIEENKKLKNNFSTTLIWYLGKDIENWGPAKDDLISSYIILLPFERPRTLFASLRPFNDQEIKDTQAIEKIMSSFVQVK